MRLGNTKYRIQIRLQSMERFLFLFANHPKIDLRPLQVKKLEL
jgi:hypothetical protein